MLKAASGNSFARKSAVRLEPSTLARKQIQYGPRHHSPPALAMLYDLNDTNVRALLVALCARTEATRRERVLQSEIEKVKRRMAKRSFHAMSQLIVMGGIASESRAARRYIERNDGKWRGSTVAGYLRSPYDSVYHENFRMSRSTFDKLLHCGTRRSGSRTEDRRALEKSK